MACPPHTIAGSHEPAPCGSRRVRHSQLAFTAHDQGGIKF